MGKPIAGQNQFPYTIGGFLVDGANINGTTYVEQLYIYKQRSYDKYDLIDSNGNIYQFIQIEYRNTSGVIMDYFDSSSNLVQTIPNNSFFVKIQDPSRNIYSFVRSYHHRKRITGHGDYVFKPEDFPISLYDVEIVPNDVVLNIGDVQLFTTSFTPSTYFDKSGSWELKSTDGFTTNRIASLMSDINSSTLIVKDIGNLQLAFTPNSNKSISKTANIKILGPDDDSEVEYIKAFSRIGNQTINQDTEYTIEIVTYPYFAKIKKPINVEINNINSYEVPYGTTELIRVSEDNKNYTFKTSMNKNAIPADDEDHYVPPEDIFQQVSFNFTMDNLKAEIDFLITIDESYVNQKGIPDFAYFIPIMMRTNSTFSLKYAGFNDNKDDVIYPYTSDKPNIANIDEKNGKLITYDNLGYVSFKTKLKDTNGNLVDSDNIGGVTVRTDVYDSIRMEPEPSTIPYFKVGQTQQFKYFGKIGDTEVEIPVKPSSNLYFTIDENGVATVLNSGNVVVVSPTIDEPMYQNLSIYKVYSTSFPIKVDDTEIPIDSIRSSYDILYIPYYEYEYDYSRNPTDVSFQSIPSDSTRPGLEFLYYDKSVVSVIDEDYLVETYQYLLGNMGSIYETGLATKLKGVKRGSTEMTVRSIHYPEITKTIKIVVY